MDTAPRPHTTPARALARRRVLALPLTALALAGCGGGVTAPAAKSGASDADGTRTITACSTPLTVTRTPQRAVGLHPAQTELLLRLGLHDRMVGQAQATVQQLPEDVRGQAADIPVLGADAPPQREDLLAAQPDFVYAPTGFEFSAEQGFATQEQLTSAGALVYIAAGGCEDRRMTGTVEDLFSDLEALGTIFEVEDAAKKLAETQRSALKAVETAIAGAAKPKTAQVYLDGTQLSAIGVGIEHDIMVKAGADPIYTPKDPMFSSFFAQEISAESFAATGAEAIVSGVVDDAHAAQVRQYLTTTFPDLPAVRHGRIITVLSTSLMPGTLGNVAAVTEIARGLHPGAL